MERMTRPCLTTAGKLLAEFGACPTESIFRPVPNGNPRSVTPVPVRIGNQIAVSGTTAPGETLTDQTRAALETIKAALVEAGASLDDVIRTRMYLRDMTQWEQAALAHGEVFGEIRPATTILEVSSLIDPRSAHRDRGRRGPQLIANPDVCDSGRLV